jgi:hypothetical protein
MLKAYFDDSGNAEQIVGGCLASASTWDTVDGAWAQALIDYKLAWFHAIDFENGRHPDYAHLSLDDKESLFERLLTLLGANIRIPRGSGGAWGAYLCGVASPDAVELLHGLDELDYRGHRKGVKPKDRNRFTEMVVATEFDPYCACLGLCFRLMLDHCGVSRESPVLVFVASQTKRKWKIDHVYSMATTIPRWSLLLSGLSAGPEMEPRNIRPLQAADFVAYYLGKAARKPDDSRARRAAVKLQPQFIGYTEKLGVTDRWWS